MWCVGIVRAIGCECIYCFAQWPSLPLLWQRGCSWRSLSPPRGSHITNLNRREPPFWQTSPQQLLWLPGNVSGTGTGNISWQHLWHWQRTGTQGQATPSPGQLTPPGNTWNHSGARTNPATRSATVRLAWPRAFVTLQLVTCFASSPGKFHPPRSLTEADGLQPPAYSPGPPSILFLLLLARNRPIAKSQNTSNKSPSQHCRLL